MWAGVYGRTRPVGAHRAAWELTNGPLKADQHVCHSCDTPLCVNPRHLFAGTASDNMQDASRKGRLAVPRPRRQKFTDEQVAEMVAMSRSGMKQIDIAQHFGVSRTYVHLLMQGKRRTYHPVHREGVA
jgi:hypothetical protein